MPVVLTVGVRRAERLPMLNHGTTPIDSFVRVVVAGQAQDTRVVHAQSEPVYNDQFVFNVFAEDLVKDAVVYMYILCACICDIIYIYVCVYVLIYIYICIYTHTHTHTQVMTVRGIRGAAKASAVFVGQCRFSLLKLLESRASKDGWCTLMDRHI